MNTLRRAAIVAPIRTPVGKFGGALSSLNAGDLGGIILKALIERTKIDPSRVDDVVFAQGYGSGEAPCIGHWAWLAAGLPIEVPGYQSRPSLWFRPASHRECRNDGSNRGERHCRSRWMRKHVQC